VKKNMLILLASALSTGGFSLYAQLADPSPFPKEFLQWAHVKSSSAEAPNVVHIYANQNAVEGYKTGKFPDGSVIVYDVLEAKELAGKTTEGATRRVDVMVKRTALYRDSGGWEFISYPGGDPTAGKHTEARQAACASCHAQRKEHDYVFSEFAK
jgi:Cytochrome P460